MIYLAGVEHCGNCGHPFDADTCIVGEEGAPAPGDWSVCLYCAHVTRYGDDGKRRELTAAERIAAMEDRDIRRVVWLVTVSR